MGKEKWEKPTKKRASISWAPVDGRSQREKRPEEEWYIKLRLEMKQQNPIAHSICSRLSVSQFFSSTTLTIPYSPLPNQYPIYSQEDLVSFATTKIEAIDGNPLNSLDPTYKCICSRPTLAALLFATGEEVLLPPLG